MGTLPRWTLVTLITLLTLILVLAGLASFGVVTVRSSFPQTGGLIQVSPLNHPVQVVRDGFGVPDIYADTPEDLFAAQGFVHAQDRFFEMDVRRHITSGRLSELFGESQVEADMFLRTLGLHRVAEQEVALMSARHRRYVEAYAEGVNAYIQSRSANDLSLEYAVLGLQGLSYVPEPWTVADSLAWLKVMAWDTGSNLDAEIETAALTATIGERRARSLQPLYDPEIFQPIVSQGALTGAGFDPEVRRGQARVAPEPTSGGAAGTPATTTPREVIEALARTVGNRRGAERWLASGEADTGSNSWVVTGDRTASGLPILANDPHMATSVPGVFSQVGLHCRTVTDECPFDVSGFSLAGLPGVIVGHNAHIAWGLTTSYVDTQDLVLEHIRGDEVRRGEGSWASVTKRTETIRVANADDRSLTVRETSNGPVLSDVDSAVRAHVGEAAADTEVETAVALRWAALRPSNSVEAIFEINRARTFTEFRSAARLLAAPSQNLIYADTSGDIGYQLSGDVPRRDAGDGTHPTPGWDPAYAWDGMIPFEDLPWTLNPPEGYVVAANQQIVAQYPRPLGSEWSTGWRSQQIIDRLNAERTPLTADTTAAIFNDSRVRYADLIVPTLLEIEPSEDWVRDGQRVLENWDQSSGPESAGAFYFHLTMKHIMQLTFDDEIPADLRTGTSDRWYGIIGDLLREPNNEWWDDKSTTVIEDRTTILDRALSHARRDATQMRSLDAHEWAWGHSHRLRLRHQTLGRSGVGALESVFNRGDEPVGGGAAVVLAWAFDDRTWGFEVTTGPVMKMVVDLASLDDSRWVNLSGQSGHAYHPNYADQLPLIAENRLQPWAFTRPRVEDDAVSTLELLPGR